MNIQPIMLAALLAASTLAHADEQRVVMRAISDEGAGPLIGTVKLRDTPKGLVLTPNLVNLPAGLHGFHVHEHANCDTAVINGKPTAGQAAGGHFDPHKTGKHAGPMGNGHLGDLPALEVNVKGEAVKPLLAPHLKLADIKGHALIIHAGGDNYSDQPKPLGGGGARIACGIVE